MKSINKESKYPAVDIIERDPQLAASLSKLERSPYTGNFNKNISTNSFEEVLDTRSKSNSDISGILKLLPDVALGKQIMISCILSPKDMLSTDLLFLTPKDLFSPDLNSSVISILKRYFNEEYKIKELLPIILEEALYDKGSYPIAVLPESAIDDFINGNKKVSTESFRKNELDFKRNIGILGNSTINKFNNRLNLELSLESNLINKYNEHLNYKLDGVNLTSEEYITIIDNIDNLKKPSINKIINKESIKSRYSENFLNKITNEDLKEIDNNKLNELIFRNRNHKYTHISNIPKPNELSRRSIGKPLVMKLPSESVIPVYVPGNVRQHIGYFVLLDNNGNPIEVPDGDHDYSKLNNSSLGSNLIKKVESSMGQGCCNNGINSQHSKIITNLYADLVEKDLIDRLKNGAYNEDVEISRNEEVYRIMLSRVLAKKQTKLLYIPIDYLTYIAFKYNDNGIGKSILEDSMTINTLRIVMLFTDIMASIKNSIGRTKVAVTLPEKDSNAIKTMEKIVDEVVKNRSMQLPMNMINPNDITDFIQKSGLEFEFDGNSSIPNLKINYENINSNYIKADTDLQDSLKNASISSLGLSPEVVTNSNSPEFATTIIANNALLSKRIVNYQDMFAPQISDHLKKIAVNSEGLILELKELIKSNIKGINIELDETNDNVINEAKDKLIVNKALSDLLNGFYVELPRPNSSSIVIQLDDLKSYSDGVESILNDAYLNEELFKTETVGDLANILPSLKAMYKSYFVRKYMSDKGILPELSEILSIDETGKSIINMTDIIDQHISVISKEGLSVFTKLQKTIEKNIASMSKFNSSSSEETEPEEESSEEDIGGEPIEEVPEEEGKEEEIKPEEEEESKEEEI